MLHCENGYVAPAVFPLADMLKQTIGQADEIICGKVICPICAKQPVRDCVCQFYRELSGVYGRVVPAKYKPFLLCNLRPSECSRLPWPNRPRCTTNCRPNPTAAGHSSRQRDTPRPLAPLPYGSEPSLST